MFDGMIIMNDIRKSIEFDVVNVAAYHAQNGGGHFGIPRQVFCIVDFLGGVAYNNVQQERDPTSTRKAARFITEFFPPHYRPYSHLLVTMWRHGTVHRFRPATCRTRDGGRTITLTWSSNNGDEDWNRAVNIRFLDTHIENTIVMSVNITQLASDLLCALDGLIALIESDAAFGRACFRRLGRLISPVVFLAPNKSISTRKSKQKRTRPNRAIRNQDTVRRQILKAAASTEGILENDQVAWYRDTTA